MQRALLCSGAIWWSNLESAIDNLQFAESTGERVVKSKNTSKLNYYPPPKKNFMKQSTPALGPA